MIKISPLLLLLAACSTAPAGVAVHDPYEVQNRAVHEFNKSIGESISTGGDSDGPMVPVEIAEPIVNFADNVALPGMVLNGLLQADIGGAATNAMRFIINTTIGVGGIFDPADTIGLAEEETDFGQTLTVWGVPEGAYLELPILGPSTERDLAGKIIDAIIDPLAAYGTPTQIENATIAKLAERVIKVDQYGDTIDAILEDSADSYASARSLYLQNRRFELDVAPVEEVDLSDLYGDFE